MPRPSIHLVRANVGQNETLPVNGRIELAFDRLLQPASITRQTFILENAAGTVGYTPTLAYDPVARVVTITPLTDKSQMLTSGQSYELIILAPKDAADPNGLRAIDGATLDAPSPRVIAFTATDATPTVPATVSIDFCRDVFPITSVKCSLPMCHGEGVPTAPAAGLLLDPPSGIAATAVGRVAQGANTGPQSLATAPTLLFGEDMPIIDPTGDPGNSWLMYKVLLAAPSAELADAGGDDAGGEEAGAPGASMDSGAPDATTDASGPDATVDAGTPAGADASPADAGEAEASTDGGADAGPPAAPTVPPVDVSGVHSLAWQGISAAERASLSNYILGREMPFPPPSNTPPSDQTDPLTLDELERLSLWIAQGSHAPASCP